LRLHYLVAFAAIGAYNPFFPTWLRARGIEGFAMSALTSLNPILGTVSPVVFGLAADRFGFRGSLMRVAAVGATLPFFVLTILGALRGGPSYETLYVLVASFAFFRSPLVTVADVTTLEEPGSYARTRSFGSVGFALAALFVGIAVDVTSPWALPLAITVALVGTCVVTSRIRERAARPVVAMGPAAVRLLKSPEFLLLLGAAFLWNAAHVSYDLCFSLHLKDSGVPSRGIGVAWAVGVVAEILLMIASPRLFRARRPAWLFAAGIFATALRFALLTRVHTFAAMLLLQPLHALTFGLTWISGLECVKHRAPANVLATAQSAFAVATALGAAAGMLVWGPLYAERAGSAVFQDASAVAVLGLVMALALVRFAPQRRDETTA
jgi:PPP family 3-phenylpropionic acid transporter